ncbi:hypothetical protein HU200_033100 [Digitaria exilis]|uniref:non-specific serine/threonine protein kinase n=1 Tax=Digitaria exilis TaxID=1010633 RepID=A0A835BLM7_9POAL|nr:hypothetical protein HU200_033100 [Digitaria exilis]
MAMADGGGRWCPSRRSSASSAKRRRFTDHSFRPDDASPKRRKRDHRYADPALGLYRSGNSRGRDEGREKERHRDSETEYRTSDGYIGRPRSDEKGRDAGHKRQRCEEVKDNSSFLLEDQEECQVKVIEPKIVVAQGQAKPNDQQQMQKKQQVESVPRCNVDGDKITLLKGDSRSSCMANARKPPVRIDIILATKRPLTEKNEKPLTEKSEKQPTEDSEKQLTKKSAKKSEKPVVVTTNGEQPAGIQNSSGKMEMHIETERNVHPDNWDDGEGYYAYRLGELLGGRYQITAGQGKGVFSKVVRAKDLKAGKDDPEKVAIKIIRSNDTMYRAGKQEVEILEKLTRADRDDSCHCVRYISNFRYRNHLCLVLESLHMNLREVLKKFGRGIGLKLTAVRLYAKQIFIALKHLKGCRVLHCDIKPDNILVNQGMNVLKLCDFGNAMLAGKNEVTPYLVSRFYRAPEIILGLPYDHPLDMWSVGCCLYELCTGKILFQGKSNNEMLRLHMDMKGPFPKKMLRKGAFTMQHFNQDLNFQATDEYHVTRKIVRRLIFNIKPKGIGSYISSIPGEDPKTVSSFKDLLDKIFSLEPAKRLTVEEALLHPFITGK